MSKKCDGVCEAGVDVLVLSPAITIIAANKPNYLLACKLREEREENEKEPVDGPISFSLFPYITLF